MGQNMIQRRKRDGFFNDTKGPNLMREWMDKGNSINHLRDMTEKQEIVPDEI